MFRKAHKLEYGANTYGETDFKHCAKNGEINWPDYQIKNKVFVIKVKEFEEDISVIAGQHIPIADTFKLLNIPFAEIKKGKFRGNAFDIVKIDTYNLTSKLFGINIYDFEELEELQRIEEETRQREAEADKILNRKTM